jgi:hypothetical protein
VAFFFAKKLTPARVREEVYFLELFFRNLLMGENNELKNRYLLVNPPEEWKQEASAEQVTDKHPTSTRQVPDKLRPNNQNIIQLIQIIGENELSVKDMISAVGLKDRENFLQHYLNPAIQEGYVRMLYPDSPRHPRQKYLLTVKGMALFNELTK